MTDNTAKEKPLAESWQELLEEQRRETAKIADRILEAQQLQSKWLQIQVEAKKRFDGLTTELVEFNVGGESFTATKSSLANCPLSLFYILLATDIWLPDDHNEYFFDRDPSYFSVCLEFVRSGQRRGRDLDPALLTKEFEFFGLNEIQLPKEPGPLALGSPPKACDAQPCQDRFAALFNSNKHMTDLYRSTFTGSVLRCETELGHWRRAEDRLRRLAADAKTKITFKVGGPKFCTTPATIKGSEMLSSYASGRWTRDKDGAFWLDKNGRIFAYVLRYLRLGIWNLQSATVDEREDIMTLAKFLLIKDDQLPVAIPAAPISPLLKDFPMAWLPGKKVALIYRASRDGWTSADFHKCVDSKGPTLVLVKSTAGSVFGGYAAVSWNAQAGHYVQAPGSWLFSLRNRPFQCTLRTNGHEMYCNPSYGPTFGSGHDLCIGSNPNQNGGSYSNLGYAYNVAPGLEAKSALAGSYNFQVAELEVFSVQ